MSAEGFQRQRISTFCRKHGLAVPNYSSSEDLSFCISRALDILDGGGSTGETQQSLRIDELTSFRDKRQAQLDAYILETQRLEMELSCADESNLTAQAVTLLVRIERIAAAALESDGER